MQLTLRTAFALLALTLFASVGHAADPADDSASEAQAIQGDEGKSSQDSNATKPGQNGAEADDFVKEYDRETDQ
jgi:hypothetical protein